jgi:peptide/nickel transport system permease protein
MRVAAGSMASAGDPSRAAVRTVRDWPLRAGLAILVAIVIASAFAPMIAGKSPTATHAGHVLRPPSGGALFGTDDYGRDMLSRVLYAGRYDLGISLFSVLLAASVGVPIGAVLGYFGTVVDSAAMRLLEIIQAFPVLILALLLVATLGPTVGVIVFVCAALNTPIYIRIARAEFQVQRNLDYADAARILGVAPRNIIVRHIWPNATAPIVAYMPISAVNAILVAAGLGFLGIGVRPPTPEWGGLVASGTEDVVIGAWWTSVFPGIALVAVSLAFYLIGDGLERRRLR